MVNFHVDQNDNDVVLFDVIVEKFIFVAKEISLHDD